MQYQKQELMGRCFWATGGGHTNSHEFFRAQVLKDRKEEIAALEDKKKDRPVVLKRQKAAALLIRKKGELTHDTFGEFTCKEINVLLKWKGVKGESDRKKDIIDTYVAAPKPKPVTIWKLSEEAELQAMKDALVPLKDTTLGVAVNQMARAVAQNLGNLDAESMASLKSALQTHDTPTGETTEWLVNARRLIFVDIRAATGTIVDCLFLRNPSCDWN